MCVFYLETKWPKVEWKPQVRIKNFYEWVQVSSHDPRSTLLRLLPFGTGNGAHTVLRPGLRTGTKSAVHVSLGGDVQEMPREAWPSRKFSRQRCALTTS